MANFNKGDFSFGNEFEDPDREILDQIKRLELDDVDYSKMTPLEVGKRVFDYPAFKENGQEEIIDHIMKKKGNALGVIPTGGGKSACFQIPALIQENMTVVVSPLIALMKDQVQSLLKKGINSAFFFNSSL